MKMKFQSYFLLFLLLSIGLFLVGFRYGRYVEYLDKTYVPLTPTIKPTDIIPSPTVNIYKIKTYNSTSCHVSFLIPDSLKSQTNKNNEVLADKLQKIMLNCDQKDIRKRLIDFEDATPSAVYKIASQKVYTFDSKKNYNLWTVKHPQSQDLVLFEVSNNLLPMIIKTLEFDILPQPTTGSN